jgi:hypothetical protein
MKKLYLGLFYLTFCSRAFSDTLDYRLVFTGDILLTRQVQHEIDQKSGLSPWTNLAGFFKGADWVMGNLEGTIGSSDQCVGTNRVLCFATDEKYLTHLREAGFTALGVENNHSGDLGDAGRMQTKKSVSAADMAAVDFDSSPGFLRLGERTLAFIALTNVPGQDGKKVEIPSVSLTQKIRLAKALADWVVVFVHWGAELADWPQDNQRTMAEWLVAQGVDAIVGHHPHVVQKPTCLDGKPVFYSLGNHVFDQKYPETKEGLLADCRIYADQLYCIPQKTETPTGSSFPSLKPSSDTKDPIIDCKVKASEHQKIAGYRLRPKLADHQFVNGDVVLEGQKSGLKPWSVVAKRLLSLDIGKLNPANENQEYLFTLERHRSSIDQEEGPRPYVYEVTPRGLIAKWRGSALAWPLVDGRLITESGVDYLCALHRNDSFLMLNPSSSATRTIVYRWNGFGFSGLEDVKLQNLCNTVFNRAVSTKS